jgi:hypothetical protein
LKSGGRADTSKVARRSSGRVRLLERVTNRPLFEPPGCLTACITAAGFRVPATGGGGRNPWGLGLLGWREWIPVVWEGGCCLHPGPVHPIR